MIHKYNDFKDNIGLVVYFHGLDAAPVGDKIDFLNDKFINVYAPHVNYRSDTKKFFESIYQDLKDKNIKTIIGSSMGGYLAYCLCRKLNVEGLLFNPVLTPDIPKKFDIDFDVSGTYNPHFDIVVGKLDDLIPFNLTKKWIDQNIKDFNIYIESNMGHRVSIETFTKYINKYV